MALLLVVFSGGGGAWVICGPEGPVWTVAGARRGTSPLWSLGAEAGTWASLPLALLSRWVGMVGGPSTVQSEFSAHPPTHPLTTDTERKHPSSRCCRSPLAPPSVLLSPPLPPYLDPFTCKSQRRATVFVHLGFLGLSSLPAWMTRSAQHRQVRDHGAMSLSNTSIVSFVDRQPFLTKPDLLSVGRLEWPVSTPAAPSRMAWGSIRHD